MPAFLRPLSALLLLVGASASLAQQLQSFPTADLTIETAGGPRKFHVELATSPPQLEQGLMFRRTLAPDAGMLFDFKTPSPVSMWMKNTFIPLDMVFIDAGGRVINIAERTVPQSLDPVAAAGPARAVLEVNGGTASRLGIKPGDRVLFPIFGNAS
jgi:uncharacterized protein